MKSNAAPRGQQEHAEDILGQYLYALGAGGAPQWISRAAVRQVREHYIKAIQKAIGEKVDWDQSAPHVLDYLRAIGQLAGFFALRDGRHVIEPPDLERAIAAVEANYQTVPSLDGSVPFKDGAWCPPKG